MKKIIALSCLVTICFSAAAFCEGMDNPYQIHSKAAILSVTDTPWNAERHIALVEKANEQKGRLMNGAPSKSYPISESDLKALYEHLNEKTIPFFAYSSLIDNESSAAKAISSEGILTSQPAIAFGIQRTFNREMDPKVAENFGALRRPNDVAILNCFEKKDAIANGVLLQLSLPDLRILCKREVGYDLIPVLAMLWDEAADAQQDHPSLILAYTFRAPDYTGEGERFTNPAINPIPGYVEYLQKGLKQRGKNFEAMWWSTTYLADKHTLLSEMIDREIDCGIAETRK
jgi:hypothetical protein